MIHDLQTTDSTTADASDEMFLADAWDAGERHPSAVHPVLCWPHASCNPNIDPALAEAWSDGCHEEEQYLGVWGQFNPTGHLLNPYRYPAAPLVTDAARHTIIAMHLEGRGTRPISAVTGTDRRLVTRVIRTHHEGSST